jgi:predicted transcriptional regulator
MAIQDVVLPDDQEKTFSQAMGEGLESNEASRHEAQRRMVSAGLMDLERGRFTEVSSEALGDYLDEIGNKAAALAGYSP